MPNRKRKPRTLRIETTKKRIEDVRCLRKKGLSIKEIVLETGLSINTVKKYVQIAGEPREKRIIEKPSRKDNRQLDDKQRHFRSQKQLYKVFAKNFKIDERDVNQYVMTLSFDSCQENVENLPYMVGDKLPCICCVPDVPEAISNDKNAASLNVKFCNGLIQLEKSNVRLEDIYSLNSIEMVNGVKRSITRYYYIFFRGNKK